MTTETNNVVRTGTSSDIIQNIFALHFPDAVTVLDLTYGRGAFWKWDFRGRDLNAHINDRFIDLSNIDSRFSHVFGLDCRNTGLNTRYDVVVFDPPFSSMGKRSDGAEFGERYGGMREDDDSPQNISDIARLQLAGLLEATRLATMGVIIKTQAVIESGRVWDLPGEVNALLNIPALKYRVVEPGMGFLTIRPSQDAANKARGAVVRNFQQRPSMFIVAKPTGRKRT